MNRIAILLLCILPIKSLANLCQVSDNVRLLNKGIGIYENQNIYIQNKIKKNNYMIYNISYNGQKIYVEFGDRVHGDIFLFRGMNFEEFDIMNLRNLSQDDPIKLLVWHVDDNHYYAASMFSDGYTGVFIQSNYEKKYHNNMMEFMNSLMFIDNERCLKIYTTTSKPKIK